MKRPLRRPLIAAGAALALAISGIWARLAYPPMSAAEHRLVGAWKGPDPYLSMKPTWVTARGPLNDPVHVWQFRRDRTFLIRVTSASDPDFSVPYRMGRWSASGRELRLEGFDPASDYLREMRERVRVMLGGRYVGRTWGEVSHTYRFLGRDTWELTTPDIADATWTRLP